jgi:Domain of unknown function (DUF222)/HNH endonuclease
MNMCSEGGVRGSWTSAEIFDEINSLLNRLATEDLNEVPAESMGEDQIALQRIGNRVQAEALRRLRRFDSGQGYASSPAVSAKAWLRWKCNLTYAAASDQVEVARQLDSLPQTSEAFADGEISYRHASLIARTAERLGDKMESNAENILVTAAKDLDPHRLRRVTIHLRHYLEPDGVLEDANEDHERRYLYLSQTLDGVFYLNGRFDAEGGALLRTALDSLIRPPAPNDGLSGRQRTADAMTELARRQLEGGQLPEVGGQKPHLAVTVDLATLSKQPGAPAAELEWAQPIPAETARRIACDAAITPIFNATRSESPQPAPTSRVISGPIHRTLKALDKGCRFPGCDYPADWTDAHHIKHWADGGPSTLPNLVLLCRRHHRRVHEEGWTIELEENRELVAYPP